MDSQMNHCPRNADGWSLGCEIGSAMHNAESTDPAAARAVVTQKATAPSALAAASNRCHPTVLIFGDTGSM